MRLSLLRVPPHHRPRRGRGGTPQHGARPALSRSLVAHLAWSALIVGSAAVAFGLELSSPCPPGGPLAFGSCERVRPFVLAVVALAAALYVIGLSAVRWWTLGLQRRRLADGAAARDWYLLAAGLGLLAAPLLAFTLVSALR